MAITPTPQPQGDFQYVKMPDGSYGKFAGNADDATIHAAISKDFPGAFPSAGAAKADTSFDQTMVAPQMAPRNESIGHHIARGISNVGGGVIGTVTAPFEHPIETAKSIAHMAEAAGGNPAGLFDVAQDLQPTMSAAKEHPEETLESGLGSLIGSALLGEGIGAGVESLPSKARAIQSLNEVSNAAKNVPVTMAETSPALDAYRNYVTTGGKSSPVMTKLGNRISPLRPSQMAASAAKGPVMFPEARDFYTNVSQASARPGFLRRAIESPAMPNLRRNIGGVREAMSSDLTDAAQSVGMGDKYTSGINEYRNAARLRSAGKIAGAVATEEALRRSGLLGKMASTVIGK